MPRHKEPWLGFRMGLAYTFFLAFFGFVAFRLVQLQVLVNPELHALAQRQFQKIDEKAPYRLPILDRNHVELAISIPASSVFARPRLVTRKKAVAKALAKAFGGQVEHWLAKLRSPKPFIWIQRQVSEEAARKLAKQELPGIYVESENKRFYPNGMLAANVIGFTDIDGHGLAGTELSLNEGLLQKGQGLKFVRDGKGNPAYLDQKQGKTEEASEGIYLTLDRRLQHILEEELERGLKETGAKAVMAVVMDPFTGEIFSLGQRPTFDPNRVTHFSDRSYANRFISNLYEPGSTLKVLLAAEAIQSGILEKNSPIDCENGHISFGRKLIKEAESNHQFGVLPLEKVLRFSSNIGAVKIAQALGADRVRATLDKFGLTTKTGIDLPGEVSSSPKGESFWKPIALATVGFGQGISVTPLQMVSAYAALANGGYLVRPKIFLNNPLSSKKDKLEVRRVLSPETVRILREILISVTEDKGGTGFQARIPGIHVAGKTGTAQKYEPGLGYDGRKYFSSFIGYLPAEQPQLLVGVMIDEPSQSYYAGQVAAPLFKRIAERSLQILDRAPKQSIAQLETTPAQEESQPAPVAEMVEISSGNWLMPDLKGASMRDCVRTLGRYLNNVKWVGNGYLQNQFPEAGAALTPNSRVVLYFSPAG